MNRLTLGCFVFILLILGTTSVSSKEEYNINKIHFAIRHNTENDKYYITAMNDERYGVAEMRINYCPFCGRKIVWK